MHCDGKSFALLQATHQWYTVPCSKLLSYVRRCFLQVVQHQNNNCLLQFMSVEWQLHMGKTHLLFPIYYIQISSSHIRSTYKSEHIYFFPCVPSPHLLFATLYSFSFQDSWSCGVVINHWGWAPTPPKIRSSTSITDAFLVNSYVDTVIEPRSGMQLSSIVQLGKNKHINLIPKKFAKRNVSFFWNCQSLIEILSWAHHTVPILNKSCSCTKIRIGKITLTQTLFQLLLELCNYAGKAVTENMVFLLSSWKCCEACNMQVVMQGITKTAAETIGDIKSNTLGFNYSCRRVLCLLVNRLR